MIIEMNEKCKKVGRINVKRILNRIDHDLKKTNDCKFLIKSMGFEIL
jgi:hypothetical protein